MIKTHLTNSLVFSSSRYFLVGLSAIRNIVVARYLGPEEYGLWIIVLLVLSYGDQIHLGLRHAGDREIPFFRGQGKTAEGQRVIETLYSAILILSIASVIILLTYTLVAGTMNPLLRTGIQIASIIVVSDQINKFYLMVIRARKEFILSSKVETIFELVRTVLVCILVIRIGYYGIIFAFVFASIMNVFYFIFRYDRTIVPKFDYALLRRELSIGIPLFFSGLLYLLTISLDRVIGASILSKEDLGIYGFAALTALLPVTSSQAIGLVFYPEMSEKIGETSETSSIFPYFAKVTLSVAYVAPLLVASIVGISELLIITILPAFGESVRLIYLLANGIFFLTIAPIPLLVLMASGRPKYFLRAQMLSILLTGCIYISVVFIFPGTGYLAMAAALSYSSYTFILILSSTILFRIKLSDAVADVARIFFPCVYGALLITALYHLNQAYLHVIYVQPEYQALIRLALFMLLYTPLLLLMIKRIGILEKLNILKRN